MRSLIAGLAFIGVFALPAQATPPGGAYWRVETVITMTHPRAVGSGYWLTEREASTNWKTPEGKGWTGTRSLGARPATKKDEAAWRADGSPKSWTYRTEGMKISLSTEPGKGFVGPAKGEPKGFRLGEKTVTYQQLQNLPSDPAALKEHVVAEVKSWIAEAAEEAKTTAPKATINDWLSRLDSYVARDLSQMLFKVPVPPKVRSAAFQALKTTKGVTDLGRAKDPLGRSGQKLALPTGTAKGSVVKQQVIVDTKTMMLLAEYTDVTVDGKPMLGKTHVETYTAGWTDEQPAVPDGK
ncbi:hypothetical protein [Nonomuraea sp. NEAU-A123]|uniref:hypothetical protein n=1 Tax=Nonomuraea sp. NEAU-A123 TaxID=2839649 RepID=UPI001BE417F5|nr:hypothetical protein [Nonomuraea sp. NEAU-A123]MBT2225906.1 hypothetical protein [Nonomuraea sp. NEAU-A123]